MPDKTQIRELIENGKTEDALALLARSNADVILLQARFNSGKRQYNTGQISAEQWQILQNQINAGVIDLANATFRDKPDSGGNKSGGVFISYNHSDSFAMRSVRSALEEKGIKTFVDVFQMQAGEGIQSFIDKALEQNLFILSIVSANSLSSGWVNIEISAAMLLSKFGQHWIPARIDNTLFDNNFVFSAQSNFETKIEEARTNIRRALDQKMDIRPFQDELARLEDLKSNFGKVIATLKSVLVVDLSGDLFDSGMGKIVQTIQSA